MSQLKLVLLIVFIIVVSICTSHAEVFTWEDANGIHFVDDISKVPVKYRNDSKNRTSDDTESVQNNDNVNLIEQKVTDNELRMKLWRVCYDEVRFKRSPSFGHYMFTSDDNIVVKKIGDEYSVSGGFFWGKHSLNREVPRNNKFTCMFNQQHKLVDVTIEEIKSATIK